VGIPMWTGRMRPIRRRWARRSCRLQAHVVCPWATPCHPSDQPTCWSRAGTWCSHQGATGSLTSPAFWSDASGTSPRGQPPRMDAGLLVGSAPARLTVRWLVVTWLRGSRHRRLVKGVIQRHEPTQGQGKRRRHPRQNEGGGIDGLADHEPPAGRSHHRGWRQPVQQAVGVGDPGEQGPQTPGPSAAAPRCRAPMPSVPPHRRLLGAGRQRLWGTG
jgi:hypothetical protein